MRRRRSVGMISPRCASPARRSILPVRDRRVKPEVDDAAATVATDRKEYETWAIHTSPFLFTVDQSPDEVFAAINNDRRWWSGEIDGSTDKPGAEFFPGSAGGRRQSGMKQDAPGNTWPANTAAPLSQRRRHDENGRRGRLLRNWIRIRCGCLASCRLGRCPRRTSCPWAPAGRAS